MTSNDREKLIKRISWFGILGNGLLSILKILTGLLAGSMAVIGDGIDSATDVLTSVITLFTAKISNKSPDMRHPYGYAKAEAIATKALAFIIFFAGAQLFISTLHKIINNEIQGLPGKLTIYVTIISILGKLVLSIIHFRAAKKANSPMLKANGKNMQNDILISLTVLIGLFFTFILHLAVLDRILALAISIWIMRSGFQIFLQDNAELLDGIKDASLYNTVFSAASSVEGVANPHRIRIRQIGNSFLVDLDIEVRPEMSVNKAHQLAQAVEKKIRDELKNVYDVIVHIEPYGNEEIEKFGISREHLK